MADYQLLPARLQIPRDDKHFHEWVFPNGSVWTLFYRTDTGYLLRFPDLADFQISMDGLIVTCYPAPEVTDETPRHLYLNQVLPLVLSRLGKLIFHASAVEIADGAVAFLAPSGRGKSTLAASFATGGFRFLTDDGLVVEACGHGYQLLPSHPSIRLWEDSQEALVGADAVTEPPLHFTSKARFLAGLDIAFCDQPRTLRRAYFLGDGSAPVPTFQRMSAAEALVEWVKNSFLLDVEEQPLLASHFDQVAKLANQQIYYRLDYPRHFEELERVRQAIVEHAQEEDGAV